MNPEDLAKKVLEILSEKKGEDILLIDVSQKTTLADYFIIAGGKSATSVRALAEAVDDGLAKLGIEPRRKEGIAEGRWAAIDYGDVIVHIFESEQREFYHLDRLWSNGGNIKKYS